MKKLLAVTLCLALSLSFSACGAQPQAMAETQETAPTRGIPNMINPFLTCEDAEEMQEKAGLAIHLPTDLPDWVTETIYRTIPGELIEVIYAGDGNELRIRHARGSVDISGVYDTDHQEQKEVTLEDRTVHLKGETGEDGLFTVYVCTWTTADGGTYSVSSPQGISETQLLPVISEIR